MSMKTTLTISLKMASKAYEAITDNRKLEEKLNNEFPNTWEIETDDPEEHDDLLLDVIEQLGMFGIHADEYSFSICRDK